jgi:hypothetical protein
MKKHEMASMAIMYNGAISINNGGANGQRNINNQRKPKKEGGNENNMA